MGSRGTVNMETEKAITGVVAFFVTSVCKKTPTTRCLHWQKRGDRAEKKVTAGCRDSNRESGICTVMDHGVRLYGMDCAGLFMQYRLCK